MAEEGGLGATIGLHDAATLTGLSISTLRRWADDGRLPSYRTQGGHRRFRADDLQRALLPAPAAAGAMDVFDALATSRIRRQLGASRSREFDWLSGIDDSGRERLRLLGRHLLTTIEDYLAARRPKATVLAEARQFGLMYGRELATAEFTVRQGMEAFTFFRRSVEEAARRYAAQERLSADRLEDLRDQLDALSDRLLLGIAEAFDSRPAQARGA